MNAKGDLIARLLNLGLGTPTFDVEASGPAHEQQFRVRVSAGGRLLGSGGPARIKKEAERQAAEAALRALDGPAGDTSSRVQGAAAPWPIYAAVLAGALDAALDLAPEGATLDEVRAGAAELYRGLLSDLGHGPGMDED